MRFPKSPFSFVQAALREQQFAQIEKRVGIARFHGSRIAKAGFGLIPPSGGKVQGAQAIPGGAERGICFESLLQKGECMGFIPAGPEGQAQVGEGLGVAGIRLEESLVVPDGFPKTSLCVEILSACQKALCWICCWGGLTRKAQVVVSKCWIRSERTPSRGSRILEAYRNPGFREAGIGPEPALRNPRSLANSGSELF